MWVFIPLGGEKRYESIISLSRNTDDTISPGANAFLQFEFCGFIDFRAISPGDFSL